MRRRAFDLLCVLSLLIALLAAGLWARSYSGTDMAYFGFGGWLFAVECSMGRVEFMVLGPHARTAPLTFDRNTDQFWGRPRFSLSEKHGTWRTLGWGYGGNTYGGQGAYRALIAPLWFPIAVAILPLVFAWKRRSRTQLGMCSKCGYDRRGTAEGAACPECGAEARA